MSSTPALLLQPIEGSAEEKPERTRNDANRTANISTKDTALREVISMRRISTQVGACGATNVSIKILSNARASWVPGLGVKNALCSLGVNIYQNQCISRGLRKGRGCSAANERFPRQNVCEDDIAAAIT